ncbi:hypothetical protein NYE48_24220 [Paenibacillus sp. FSL M7-1455]|jgi:hypothetical protein|uniref:Uncharacterized protein n=1 Tax=Paenibacillus cookii TaxID=157839 RepID=A0ABQ4M2K1_9BACL|nr:hypothetical protein [Paenibacillus cookii]GIO69770.1 hypothetical protein J21TS3_45910 [Paenibacillus cookii]
MDQFKPLAARNFEDASKKIKKTAGKRAAVKPKLKQRTARAPDPKRDKGGREPRRDKKRDPGKGILP